jgi:hypothetical protein
VQEEGEEEKAIHSPGVEGLHVLLEECLGEALHCDVSAFDVSVDSVKKVFMDKDWLLDMSFKWNDVANLLEALGLSEFKFKEDKELPDIKEEKNSPCTKKRLNRQTFVSWLIGCAIV